MFHYRFGRATSKSDVGCPTSLRLRGATKGSPPCFAKVLMTGPLSADIKMAVPCEAPWERSMAEREGFEPPSPDNTTRSLTVFLYCYE